MNCVSNLFFNLIKKKSNVLLFYFICKISSVDVDFYKFLVQQRV
jgi:hypothetical protein